MRFKTLFAAASILAIALPAASYGEPFPFAILPFKDLPPGHPAYEAIDYFRLKNVVVIKNDWGISPDEPMTRAELLRLLLNPYFIDIKQTDGCARGFVSATGSVMHYRDVSAKAWYANDVCAGTTKNIIDGYPDGTFRAHRIVTFAEASKMIGNVLSGNDTNDTDPVNWYKKYVTWLSERRAIPRSVNGLEQRLTRAEAIEILYRLSADVRSRPYRNATYFFSARKDVRHET